MSQHPPGAPPVSMPPFVEAWTPQETHRPDSRLPMSIHHSHPNKRTQRMSSLPLLQSRRPCTGSVHCSACTEPLEFELPQGYSSSAVKLKCCVCGVEFQISLAACRLPLKASSGSPKKPAAGPSGPSSGGQRKQGTGRCP